MDVASDTAWEPEMAFSNRIKRSWLIVSFLTGGMVALPWIAAAAFAGWISPFALTTLIVIAVWVACNLTALSSFVAQPRRAATFALCGSMLVTVISVYCLVYSLHHSVYDPLYFTAPLAIWIWLGIPLFFNSVEASFSIIRLLRIRSPR